MSLAEPEPVLAAQVPEGDAAARARKPDIEAYIRERVLPQLAWHEGASRKGKQMHWGLSSVQLGATASVPIVNTMGDFLETTIITSVLAGCAAVATGFAAFGKHQENWLRSRKTVAALEEALARHRHGVDPFSEADADARFVHMVEDILRGEHESWQTEMARKAPVAAKASKGDKT